MGLDSLTASPQLHLGKHSFQGKIALQHATGMSRRDIILICRVFEPLAAQRKSPRLARTSSLEGQVGLEPTTFCLRGRRSNQLSYWPIDYSHEIVTNHLCFGKCVSLLLQCPHENT